MKYIDTHAHLVGYFLEEDVDQIIKQAKAKGIEYIAVPGTTTMDSLGGIELSKKYPFIIPGFGIHPSEVSDEITNKLDDIYLSDFRFIGETGIDLYHKDGPNLDVQIRSFKKHLEIARKLKLPVEIHTREAYQEVYDVIKNYTDLTLIMHSFTGPLEWANKFIELGAYISFSGIVTFKNADKVKEVMLNIPLNKILIETDSPFLTPAPHRGIVNKPEFVKHIGDFIANERPEPNVLKTIYTTTVEIFNIK